MMHHALRIAFVVGAGTLLSGCSGFFGSWMGPVREAWRSQAENRCLASGRVKVSAHIAPMSEYDGPGACGADRPFRVTGLADGTVAIKPGARLNCQMTAAVDDWVQRIVQPQAMATFGQPVAEVKILASYGCRRINNRSFGPMSEHSYMNALDVGGFKLADGTDVSVLKDWRSPDIAVTSFLQGVGGQSCAIFATVIGPDGDANHRDHFHLDLAQRRSGRYCKGGPAGSGAPLMSYTGDGADHTGSIGHEHEADE